MLTELHIRQFALMNDVRLEFESGMTVFSGETGAGKSILVDALGAIFGARANADWVRHGADRAEITAVIENNDVRLRELLAEHELDVDEPLCLRRVINADGRSRAWLNGMPTALKLLQQIGSICLDLHGQHEHQGLMQQEFQQQLIDARLPKTALDTVAKSWASWQQAKKKLQGLNKQRGETAEQESWMRAELQQLEDLTLEVGLEERLQAEVEAGQHVAQIQQAGAEAYAYLEEGEANVRSLLAQARHAVEALAGFHQGLENASDLLAQMDVLLSETLPHLQDAQELALDGQALAQAEDQLASLRDCMRRHQCNETELLALMQEWRERLSMLDTAEWDESALQTALEEAEKAYIQAAKDVSMLRQQACDALVHELRPYLDRLGMAGMRISIELDAEVGEQEITRWSQYGWDRVGFMLSSNPGEPFRTLAQVASGGELSRLVLSLKASGAFVHAPAIAVFDEVDVGIGGETAWCVGELLSAMGRERQVFVVSHLPQVAVCAQHQVSILKGQCEGRTVTDLAVLQADERVAEIARMLGGLDTESLEHAKQMLEKGSAF